MATDKQIEVIEGNKLIAEFEKVRSFKNVASGIAYSFAEGDFRNKGRKSMVFHPDQLQYHTSWDWLMPVVKKIRNYLDNELVRPSKNHCCKGDEIEIDIHCHMTTTNIEGVWETVVKFIIWYNQHSKPQTI